MACVHILKEGTSVIFGKKLVTRCQFLSAAYAFENVIEQNDYRYLMLFFH